MRLIPVKFEEIKQRYYKRTSNQAMLEEFLKMDADAVKAVKLEGHNYKTTYQGAQSIRRSVERFGMKNIKVVSSKNEIYLIKINNERAEK